MPEPKLDGDGRPVVDDAAKKEIDPSIEQLAGIADTLKTGIEKITDVAVQQQAAPAAPTALPVDIPARQQEIREKYNDMCSAGNYAEADEYRTAENHKLQAVIAPATGENQFVKIASDTALHIAKQNHAEMFKEYGSEIEVLLKELPVEKRIQLSGVEEAIGTVTARHQQEIIDKRVAAALEDKSQSSRSSAPVAGGQHVSNTGAVSAMEISLEEQGVARSLGLTDETLIAAKKKLDGHRQRDGAYTKVPLCDGPIIPGRGL